MTDKYNGRNIPISKVAKIIGKDVQFVRLGIIQGFLPIGKAVKLNGSKKYSYYVSPKLLYEYTGYIEDDKNISN